MRLMFSRPFNPVVGYLALALCARSTQAWTSRRAWLASVPALLVPTVATALDMDAFASQQLESTQGSATSPSSLSSDEALCRYGQPSKETGDACVRAGLSTRRKTGVDAYGTVDRGDFVRCTFPYETIDGKYVQQRICK